MSLAFESQLFPASSRFPAAKEHSEFHYQFFEAIIMDLYCFCQINYLNRSLMSPCQGFTISYLDLIMEPLRQKKYARALC